jgi:hypothetical protein
MRALRAVISLTALAYHDPSHCFKATDAGGASQ